MNTIATLFVVVLSLLVLAEAQTCPSSGIVCHPSDCSTQYKQCVGTTFYPVQDTAAGTKCYQGGIVAANDPKCSGGPAPTPAPTRTPTRAPTPGPATTRAPTPAPATTRAPTPAPGSCSLSQIFTQADFNALFPNANGAANRGDANQYPIFTYSNLINAAKSFPAFGCTGDITRRKRELAAFLGQTSHETSGWWSGQPYNWGYFFSTELCAPGCVYCSGGSYPCAPGQGYYGRGPLQLTHNYNYGPASQALFGDNSLLNNPNLVVTNGVTAFKTALWFWMTPQAPKPSAHDVITGVWSPSGSDSAAGRVAGYGMLTNIINGGLECSVPTPPKVASRVGYYTRYTSYFGVSDGGNLYCNNMQHY